MTDLVFTLPADDGSEYKLTLAKVAGSRPDIPDNSGEPDVPDDIAEPDGGTPEDPEPPDDEDEPEDPEQPKNPDSQPEPTSEPAMLPTGIRVQVGDWIDFSDPNPGQSYINESDGRLEPEDGKSWNSTFTAVRTGTARVSQWKDGGGKFTATITIEPDDGSEPMLHTSEGDEAPIKPEPDEPEDPKDEPAPEPEPPHKGLLERLQSGPKVGKPAHVDFKIGGKKGSLTAGPNEWVRGRFDDGSFTQLMIFNDPIVGVSPANCLLTGPKTLPTELTIKVGKDTLMNGRLDIPNRCRAHPYRNWTPQPQKKPILELLLNYGTQAANSGARWAKETARADNGRFGLSYCAVAMGGPGERKEIGPRTASDAALACNLGDPQLLDAARQFHDSAGSWGYFVLDPETLLPPDPRKFPRITLLWAARSSKNPIKEMGSSGKGKLTQAASHAPSFGTGGYAVWGSEFDRQNMVAWAMCVMRYWQNPSYCARDGASVAGPDKNGWLHGQVRGHAWGLRTLVDAWMVDPDNDVLDMMLSDFAAALEYYFRNWDQSDGAMWYLTSGAYMGGEGMAPWQMDFGSFAMAHAVASGREEYRNLMNHFSVFQKQRVLNERIEFSAHYDVPFKNSQTKKRMFDWQQMLDDLGRRQSWLRDALAAEPGSMDLQKKLLGSKLGNGKANDIPNYAGSPTGYSVMLNAAVVRLLDAGAPGFDEVYARLKPHLRADASFNPQYCLLPMTT